MARASVGGLAAGLVALQIFRLAGRSYIDPGSGSFAIQIIIASVLGGLLSARLWFRYVVRTNHPLASPVDAGVELLGRGGQPRRRMTADPEARLPGSFRDPAGFMFRRDGEFLRQVNRSYESDVSRPD